MSITPKVLYVDDDPAGCELMKYWLTAYSDSDLVSALDGKEAEQLIRQEFFDLYLLDYCLPDATATQLCRTIKSVNPAAAVIVYTALDREIDRATALDAGANFYFVKPDELDQLAIAIRQLLGDRKQTHSKLRPVEFASTPGRPSVFRRSRVKASGIL